MNVIYNLKLYDPRSAVFNLMLRSRQKVWLILHL